MIDFEWVPSLSEIEAHYAGAASNLERILIGAIAEASETAGTEAVAEMRAATPHATGELAASTEDRVVSLSPSGFEIAIHQPAETKPDKAGNWGGRFYVGWVVEGRGPVSPIYARALNIPGVGYRTSAKAAKAQPYPDEWVVNYETGYDAVVADAAEEIGAQIVAILD